MLRTNVLGMHTKSEKNRLNNKISVHNTKLHVMQTRSTLTTWSTVMRQLHVPQVHVLNHLLFIEVHSVVCDTQARLVPTFETCNWTIDYVKTC